MNSFNAVHAFNTLQMDIIVIMRTYYNNNKNLNQRANERRNCISSSVKKKSILDSLDIFLLLLLLSYLFYFSKWFFFPSKHIKLMFKVFKLILCINVERKLCSHHTVQFCETMELLQFHYSLYYSSMVKRNENLST